MKCKLCPQCDGFGCIDELPGMGGINKNKNFQLNCSDWIKYYSGIPKESASLPAVRLAPITGSVQNIGYTEEEPYYLEMLESTLNAGFRLSIGDGAPDEKIQFGIAALAKLNKKGAIFIKPYDNKKIMERIEWSNSVAEIQGVDIDSHKIKTMNGQAVMFPKTASDLKELKKYSKKRFVIKGIFLEEDIALLKEVKPDIAVISNHGGRVSTRTGSTADFLATHHKEIASYCGEIWIDGGIRRIEDLAVAAGWGVKEVMIGRPFISALIKYGKNRLTESTFLKELSQIE